CPIVEARECRAEHQADDPVGARKDVLEREHPAPRAPEQVDAVEAELLPDGGGLVAEELDAPLDVRRAVGVAAPDLVVDDDAALLREPLEGREVVVRGAGPAVQREKRRALLTGRAVPGAVAAEVDVSLRDGRSHAGLQYVSCPLSSVGR